MAKAIQEATPATVETLERKPNGNGLSRQRPNAEAAQNQWDNVRGALLKTALRRDANGLKRLDGMCDAVMDKAIEGNMQAVMFITERLDGKATQTIDMKQDITVSSIGEAHLHALQRLTDAVTRHDEAKPVSTLDTHDGKTIEGEATPNED